MIKLAVVDAVVGFVPVAGTIFDIFIRPSRKALDVVHTHIREEYAIQSDIHVVHPYLHEKLEKKQQQSAFWRNPVVSWLWLHIPDLLGAFVLLLIGLAVWWGASYLWDFIKPCNQKIKPPFGGFIFTLNVLWAI